MKTHQQRLYAQARVVKKLEGIPVPMMASHHRMNEEEISSLLRETEAMAEDITAYRAFCRNRQAILDQLVRLENLN